MSQSAKTADREDLTRRYGKEIFARLEGAGPLPFGPAWWDDRLMEMTMGDEAVKLQLFRFVDVLPQLRSPADVTRHLREYFAAAGDRVPGWMRLGLRLLPSRGLLGRLLAWTAHCFRPTAGAQIHRRIEPARGPGGGRPAAAPVAGLHGRSARRGDDHREGGRRVAGRIPRIDRRPEPRGQRLAGQRPHRPRRPRPAAARQRVRQAVRALQPVRRHRPRRLDAGRLRSVCGRSSAPPANAGCSSTSTWSSIPSRI